MFSGTFSEMLLTMVVMILVYFNLKENGNKVWKVQLNAIFAMVNVGWIFFNTDGLIDFYDIIHIPC